MAAQDEAGARGDEAAPVHRCSLGDLVFDLQHDVRSQQGFIAELTFAGRRLAQADLHPTLILEASQPNLLDPDGGGDALLRARASSARLRHLP